MRWTLVALALLAPSAVGQEKSASPLSDIIVCVKAMKCPNAVASTISWADFGVQVVTVTDRGSAYAMAVSPTDGTLSIWVTTEKGQRPGQRIEVGDHGRVLDAELGPQPGENFPMRMTPEQRTQRRELRKAYRSSEHPGQLGTWGDQYKSFWQEHADAAIAAIRRQVFRTSVGVQEPQPIVSVPFEQILACVQATNCKGMKFGRLSNWSDAIGGSGLIFEDQGWKYELRLAGPKNQPPDLEIMLTAPNESRPGQLLTLDSTGKVVTGSLQRPPGEPVQFRGTREQLEASWQTRKAFVAESRWPPGGSLGEEFRPFWQKQADQALAAINRTLTSAPAQEKFVPSMRDIQACAETFTCRNMKKSFVNWYDQVNIPVVDFSEDGYRYALRNNPRENGLSIWIAVKGESRASRLFTVGIDGKVIRGELFLVPPGGGWPRRLTPEEQAKWYQDARILSPAMGTRAAVGEEFRPFWQELADQALAAIRRTIVK